jgi:hypothetical protein
MFQSTSRRSFQNRLTARQRSSLDNLTAASAAKSRREGVRGDDLQSLKNSITRAAPGISPPDVQALALYVMTDPIYRNVVVSNVPSKGDSLGDLTSSDMLRLQQTMDRKSQVESLISNMLKAYEQTAGGLVGNLK